MVENFKTVVSAYSKVNSIAGLESQILFPCKNAVKAQYAERYPLSCVTL